MKELRQMRDAVISALRAGGLAAEAAFPGKWAAERKTPLATVAVGAAEGEEGGETAAAVLLGKLPEGIRPGELSWEALAWEKQTGLFLRRGKLQCEALFLAEAGDEGPEFLDFMLKGVLRSEQSA